MYACWEEKSDERKQDVVIDKLDQIKKSGPCFVDPKHMPWAYEHYSAVMKATRAQVDDSAHLSLELLF